MTDAYVTEMLRNIDTISSGLDNNGLIANTRDAVQNGLKTFQITPAEKAKLYANFEIQFSLGVVTKLIDIVAQSGLVEQQIELEKKKIELLTQQILSETQNTEKVTAEVALLGSNKALVDAQKLTQDKQRLDVMAGINIKNQQVIATQQTAKFEEARRHVLLNSTKFNNQIQKAKEENALINSLAVDDSFTITDTHLLRSKNAMDAITTTDISYTSEITTAVGIIDAGT